MHPLGKEVLCGSREGRDATILLRRLLVGSLKLPTVCPRACRAGANKVPTTGWKFMETGLGQVREPDFLGSLLDLWRQGRHCILNNVGMQIPLFACIVVHYVHF